MDREEASKFVEEYRSDVPAFMQTFMRTWSRLYADAMISHQQAGLLMIINRKRHCRMSELADELCLSRGAITQMVDPLVAQGLIERTGDEKDRRLVLVGLTDKAQSLITQIMRRRHEMMIEIFSALSREEALTLMALIEKLGKTLKGLDVAMIIERADINYSEQVK